MLGMWLTKRPRPTGQFIGAVDKTTFNVEEKEVKDETCEIGQDVDQFSRFSMVQQ